MKRILLGISLTASLWSPAHADNFASITFSGFSFDVLKGGTDSFTLIGSEFQSFASSSSFKNVHSGEYMAEVTGDLSYLTNPAYNHSELITYDQSPWNGRYAINPTGTSDGGGYAHAFTDLTDGWSTVAYAANANNEFGGSAASSMHYYFRIDLAPNSIVALNFDLFGQVKSNIDEIGDFAQINLGLGLNGYSNGSPLAPEFNQDHSFSYNLDTSYDDWLRFSEEFSFNLSHSIALSAGSEGAYFWGSLHMSAGAANPAINSVTLVPEPESFAMLMAGLGLIGFSQRRKKINS